MVQFRSDGYWVVQAGKLAKRIKGRCVICRYLDKPLLGQRMGLRRMEFTNTPSAWQQIEIDLMGPFKCRGDKNPRVSVKVWGAVIQDVYSGAVHADVVRDYSAQAVMETLRKFAALRGWPAVISSDPGSQLESAAGKLESWGTAMEDPLKKLAGKQGFK